MTTALRWIGDLDHPHYDDERNRHVWYEASAIGFQLMFMGTYLVAGGALWLGGADALPYALAFLAPVIITSLIFGLVLKKRNAEYWPSSFDLKRSRGVFALLSVIFLISGMVRASLDSAALHGDGFFGGAAQGALVGGVCGVAMLFWKGNQQRKDEAAELLRADED